MRMNDFLKKAFSDWPVKLFSLLFAICIVFLLRFNTYSKVVVDIPLVITMPEGYVARNKIDNMVTLTINGNQKIVYLIDPHQITAHADFSSISDQTVKNSIFTNTPLAVPVELSFPDGIIDISDEIIITTDPSQIRVLFAETR